VLGSVVACRGWEDVVRRRVPAESSWPSPGQPVSQHFPWLAIADEIIERDGAFSSRLSVAQRLLHAKRWRSRPRNCHASSCYRIGPRTIPMSLAACDGTRTRSGRRTGLPAPTPVSTTVFRSRQPPEVRRIRRRAARRDRVNNATAMVLRKDCPVSWPHAGGHAAFADRRAH
jgi:hypothetical protein